MVGSVKVRGAGLCPPVSGGLLWWAVLKSGKLGYAHQSMVGSVKVSGDGLCPPVSGSGLLWWTVLKQLVLCNSIAAVVERR